MPNQREALRDMLWGVGAVLMGLFAIALSEPMMIIADVPYPLMMIVGILCVALGIGYIAWCVVVFRKAKHLGSDKETIYRKSEQGVRGLRVIAESTKPVHVPPAETERSENFTDDAILHSMPEGEHVKVSYILKALNITDIRDARKLELVLKSLVDRERIEREMQEGKSYYKKRG
jgi:hypothetical protein